MACTSCAWVRVLVCTTILIVETVLLFCLFCGSSHIARIHYKMRVSLTTLAGVLAATALALPTSISFAVHEKRSILSGWVARTDVKPDGRIVLPVRIGLTQSNLEHGHDILMDIADPSSKNYGKHWTAKQVSQNCFSNSQGDKETNPNRL